MVAEVFEKVAKLRVVPVLAVEERAAALPLADALSAGGLPIAEITFRTQAAPDVIRTICRERPEMLVGAGTLTHPDQVKQAKECGAAFGVAPGLNQRVVEAAAKVGLPFMPGVMTPSEIEHALELGVTMMKFFPAGGVDLLKGLSGPYAHLGVRFMPTGGVTLTNFRDYLALPVVAAVGGTWLAKKEDISEGHWSQIVTNCRKVRDLL